MAFKRSISIVGLLFTSLSCMVGSGWLFGAYYTASLAGPASIVSWVIGGLLIACIALVFAELSTMLPLSGGIARYSQYSHGTLTSFIVGWLAWLSCISVAPTEVQAILQYSTRYVPWLTHQQQGMAVLTTKGFMVASMLLALITWFNQYGVKTLTRFNSLFASWKMVIPALVALVLLTHHHAHFNFQVHGFVPFGLHGILMALPAGVVFSFLGFREATSLAGETANPKRAIPIAVLGSVAICVVLYSVIQLAFVGSVSPEMVQGGWHKLHFAHDTGPIAGIATILGLGWLAHIVFTDALVSPLGTGMVYTATTARLNHAMSENQYLPAFMGKLNAHGSPGMALWTNWLLGLSLFIPLPGWQNMIKFQALAIVVAYGAGPIALLALRKQAPQLNRPFALSWPVLQSFVTFYICNLLSYWTGWDIVWRLAIAATLGLALLFGYRCYCRGKPLPELHAHHALWFIPYMLGIVVISYAGNFGGKGWLSFGWDFAVIAGFTALMQWIAYSNRLTQAESERQLQALSQDAFPEH